MLYKKYPDLTVNRNNIDVKETANELYHVIFGYVNKHLIESGFVKMPDNIETEGRYLKSFYLYNR